MVINRKKILNNFYRSTIDGDIVFKNHCYRSQFGLTVGIRNISDQYIHSVCININAMFMINEL